MKLVRTAVLVPAAVLALAACGGGNDDAAPAGGSVEVPGGQAPSAAAPDAQAQATQAPATPDAQAPAAGDAGRPAQGSCTSLPEAADGLYTVADAGTVVVTRDGDRLVLGEVSPAEGWTPEEVETESDEIEIEFRRGGEELDLEVEIEGADLSIEVCADDD